MATMGRPVGKLNGALAALDPDRPASRLGNMFGVTKAEREMRSFPTPPPSPHWSEILVWEWNALWDGPHGGLFIVSDIGGLRRLFDMKEEAESLLRRIRGLRNLDEIRTLDEMLPLKGRMLEERYREMLKSTLLAVKDLEDRYALSPYARAKVGLAFSEAARAAEEAAHIGTQNEAAAEEKDDDDDDEYTSTVIPSSVVVQLRGRQNSESG